MKKGSQIFLCVLLTIFSVSATVFGQGGFGGNVSATVVRYKIGAKGQARVIPSWGIDTTWVNYHNAKGSKKNAGDQINFIRIGFYLHEPTSNDGSLSNGQIEKLDAAIKFLDMVDPEIPVMMSPNNLAGINDWYSSNGRARVDRWVNVIQRSKQYLESKGHKVIAIEVFNEPDHKHWNMGQKEDLNEICRQCAPLNIYRIGPSTLSTTPVQKWYDQIRTNVEAGSTHTLGGTMKQYVEFIRRVKGEQKLFMNPEAHSMVEAIVGAEEGADSICWWDQINPRRAAFQKANLGQRLVYVPVVENWSAACVYRGKDEKLYGFASTNERTNGKPTSYDFVCQDADVDYYPSGKEADVVFVAKGKPFRVHVEADKDNKKNMSHWFVIAPKDDHQLSERD